MRISDWSSDVCSSDLTYIARADGMMHPEEIRYLRAVAEIFGLDDAAFERVTATRAAPDGADPYRVLGVPRDPADGEPKAAHIGRADSRERVLPLGFITGCPGTLKKRNI